jgi:SAM-dependent methyltransferase
MKLSDYVDLLACPKCLSPLAPRDQGEGDEPSSLGCKRCGVEYAVVERIARFLPASLVCPYGRYFERKAKDDSLGAMDYRTQKSFRMRQRWLEPLLDAMPSGWIVDVACGNGRMTAPWCETRRVLGIDASFTMLRWARQRGLIGVEGSVEGLPLRSEVAAGVVALEIAQYLPSPSEMLREITRIARPGAHLCLSWLPASLTRRLRQQSLGHHDGSPRLHPASAFIEPLRALGWERLELAVGLWPWTRVRRVASEIRESGPLWSCATVAFLHGVRGGGKGVSESGPGGARATLSL